MAAPDFISITQTAISIKELHHTLGQTLTSQARLLSELQYSEPIVSGGYYHLIKLVHRQNARLIAFEQNREQVLKTYQQQKRLKQIDDYIEELKSDADIVIQTDYLTTLATRNTLEQSVSQ